MSNLHYYSGVPLFLTQMARSLSDDLNVSTIGWRTFNADTVPPPDVKSSPAVVVEYDHVIDSLGDRDLVDGAFPTLMQCCSFSFVVLLLLYDSILFQNCIAMCDVVRDGVAFWVSGSAELDNISWRLSDRPS